MQAIAIVTWCLLVCSLEEKKMLQSWLTNLIECIAYIHTRIVDRSVSGFNLFRAIYPREREANKVLITSFVSRRLRLQSNSHTNRREYLVVKYWNKFSLFFFFNAYICCWHCARTIAQIHSTIMQFLRIESEKRPPSSRPSSFWTDIHTSCIYISCVSCRRSVFAD